MCQTIGDCENTCQIHFGEGDSQLFPFCENVFVPGCHLSRCSPRYLTYYWWSYTLFIYMDPGGGAIFGLDPLPFILKFFKTSFDLQVSSFAVYMKQWLDHCPRLAKVAVVDSCEVGKSAVYSRYSNGPRTLPWVTPALSE
jgi:hypothetical protein